MEKVMIKKVGQAPEIVEVENVSLEYMQGVVGGWIEIPYISDALYLKRIDIVINEEGKLLDMEPNILVIEENDMSGTAVRKVLDAIHGDILFVANDGDGHTIGLSDEQIKDLEHAFKYNEVITNRGVFNYIRLEGKDI